jgi:septal ring factor EnvC (AmiA/AmiB activator)
MPLRNALAALVAMAASLTATPPAAAQQTDLRAEILESQRRLEQIRAERERLEAEIGDVRNRVRDAATELANVERRLSASTAVLAEVEFQSEATASEIAATTRDLIYSQDRLAESQAVLNRRLRDIYKMGPLHTVSVLLGASSFADLLNRYRYLQQIADSDRQLVERVQALEGRLSSENQELQERMAQLGVLRRDRVSEVAELRAVENEREAALREFRSREQRATTRMGQLEGDEARMVTLLDELEERRRTLEAARARSGGATLAAGDAGTLDWPLSGRLIYRFGRETRPNGVVLRWNGIGIAAPAGTPVRAVRSGTVALAGPYEGYGQTVWLSHGGGIYTLYLYLEEIGVVQGRDVEEGQVVGTVGGRQTPEGPHLEFQIRVPANGSTPQAQDPLQWLKPLAPR